MKGSKPGLALNFLLLLRAIRWYNIGLIVVSQYLIARFIFNSNKELIVVLQDYKLHLIVLSTACAVAAAFIINNFYDVDKDLVNHPETVVFSRLLSQNSLLNTYAGLNVLCLLFALLASVKVFFFCSVLVFVFWFYSHKLQKLPFIREVSASVLAIAPLIAIWLHYLTMHNGLVIYLGSLLIVGFTREVVKDMDGNIGNIIFGYKTMVVAAGQGFTKKWLVITNVLLALAFVIGFIVFVRDWNYYTVVTAFSISSALLISLSCLFSKNTSNYQVADSLLKATILIHILSLVGINVIS